MLEYAPMPQPAASQSTQPPEKKAPPSPPSAVRAVPILAAFVVGIGLGYVLWGREAAVPTSGPATPTAEPSRFDVSVDDDPAIGPSDAPVTLIEFGDYNCGYCRRWQQETFPDLMAEYPDQIRFVYRDLPVVGGGAVGYVAAQAADCAGDQGAYWQFHDALFSGRYGLTREAYLQYAEDLGLDADALAECLDTEYHSAEVQGDLTYALNLGITSTPTFFVNGIPVLGAQSLQTFSQLVQAELAAE
jgi:protein-disulfide isomerase